MNIELYIERLVLHGFADRVDRRLVGEAIERELARLIAERGLSPSLHEGGEVARLDGGTFEAGNDSDPEAIGLQAARTLYGGLGG